MTGVAEAARDAALHRRRSDDRSRPDGNPLIDVGAARRCARPRHEVRADAGPDAHRRRSIRISARSKPIPPSSILSAFETFFNERRPFFVEGLGQPATSASTVRTCNGLFYSRRVGRAPHGTDNLPSGDNIYTDVPGAVDDPRRRQADRPGRQVLDRRDAGRAAGGIGHGARRRRAVPAAGRAAHQLFGRPRAPGVREPVVVRRSCSPPRIASSVRSRSFPRTYTRRHRLGLAIQIVLQPRPAIWSGSSVRGIGRSDRDSSRRTAATTTSVLMRRHSRSIASRDVAQRNRRPARVQQDRRPARPVQLRTTPSSRPASTSTRSASSAAPIW